MYIIAKCINTDDYNKKFLTIGETYILKIVSNLAAQVRGDDCEYHLVHQCYFKSEDYK